MIHSYPQFIASWTRSVYSNYVSGQTGAVRLSVSLVGVLINLFCRETEANCSTYCFEADGPQKADPQCHRDRALLDCSPVINVSFANILSVSSEGNLLLPSPLSIKCNIKYKYCTSFLCSHHFH